MHPRQSSGIPAAVTRIVIRAGDAIENFADYLIPIFTVATGVAGAVAGFVEHTGLAVTLTIIFAALALLLQVAQVVWRKDVAKRLFARKSELNDVLAEVANGAAKMPSMSKTERSATAGKLVQHLVHGVIYVAYKDIAGVRAVVYEVVTDPEGVKRMEPMEWASQGTRRNPTPFTLDTDRGRKAFDVLTDDVPLFVDDISKAPEKWEGSGDGYNTFITTQIAVGGQGYGLLTVDAPVTDDLTEDDETDLRLVAGLLAVILAERDRRTPGPQPTPSR